MQYMKNNIIAASIIIAANGKLNYHLSGSNKEYSNLAPTNLLLYEVALWGCANGYKTFYLGGGVGSGNDNLYYNLKNHFIDWDDEKRFYIGKKIFVQNIYNELLGMRGNTNFFLFPQVIEDKKE